MSGAADERGVAIEPIGETTLLLRFGAIIDADLNARVQAAAAVLARVALPGVVDIVPAYATLALDYRPSVWADGETGLPWQHLAEAVRAVFESPPDAAGAIGKTIEIPVCYDAAYAPDLADVARHCGLDAATVVARHVGGDYRVAMLGFAPGFPYLLGLDPALVTPRRASPRTRVPAGSVAIGGAQTGIYPRELPGGWQVIGRTPLRLFDAARAAPSLLAPGDRVRFRAIDVQTFAALSDPQAA